MLAFTHEEACWIKTLIDYIQKGHHPEDEAEAESVSRQAKMYYVVEGNLFRRRPNGVGLRCVPPSDGRELLKDIHQGDCGHHSSSRILVGKAFRYAFYWPTALKDATELVKSCEACQFHAKQVHQPAQGLQIIPLSWPFAV